MNWISNKFVASLVFSKNIEKIVTRVLEKLLLGELDLKQICDRFNINKSKGLEDIPPIF